MDTPCPWQLYLFALVNLIGALAMYGIFWDPCVLLTSGSQCNSAEKVMATSMGFGLLYVAALFFVLTFINKGSAPKLKRLAMFGANCTVATFVGVIMTGSRHLGGLERSSFHFGDMVSMFVLFLILVSATADDAPVAGCTSPATGLGVNPKTLVLLFAVLGVIKMFVFADFLPQSYILENPDEVTDLARLFWNWLVVLIFEIVFAVVFALVYGDENDQEAVTITFAGLMIVGLAFFLPMAHHLRPGLINQWLISGAILLALCVVAVIGGRKQRAHRDYEQVASATV